MNEIASDTRPTNSYLISGTRLKAGMAGEPENFQMEIEAPSSRDAYLQAIRQPDYEYVNIVAIKIRCCNCGDCHMVIPPNLYLN